MDGTAAEGLGQRGLGGGVVVEGDDGLGAVEVDDAEPGTATKPAEVAACDDPVLGLADVAELLDGTCGNDLPLLRMTIWSQSRSTRSS